LFCVSFCTVAVNPTDVDTCTDVVAGFTDTVIGGAPVTVIVATADFVPSATDVAVSVTVAGVGTVPGALYVTPVVVIPLSVPHPAPLHPAPDRLQLTPLFCVSFCTVAVNPTDVDTCTDVVAGFTDTVIGGGPEFGLLPTRPAQEFSQRTTGMTTQILAARFR
jgi:hypothetical protein